MGFRTTKENDGVKLQYTAREQRPKNTVRVNDRYDYDVKHWDDKVLVNQEVAGATTINLYNTEIDEYLGTEDIYESELSVRDEKGDAATNNITVKDNNGTTLYTISTNSETAFFEIVNGVWVYVGKRNIWFLV